MDTVIENSDITSTNRIIRLVFSLNLDSSVANFPLQPTLFNIKGYRVLSIESDVVLPAFPATDIKWLLLSNELADRSNEAHYINGINQSRILKIISPARSAEVASNYDSMDDVFYGFTPRSFSSLDFQLLRPNGSAINPMGMTVLILTMEFIQDLSQ
jgi:hypothetical protein